LNRYTRDKQRSEIQAVPPAQFMRFLFRWQGVAGAAVDERREGEAGLLAVLRQLEGFSVAAGAWEDDVQRGAGGLVQAGAERRSGAPIRPRADHAHRPVPARCVWVLERRSAFRRDRRG
jgi:hypothetical protein